MLHIAQYAGMDLKLDCTSVLQACGGGEVTVRLWMVASQSQPVVSPTASRKSQNNSPQSQCVMIVEVIDDGPGFGATKAEVLFKPFYSDPGWLCERST